MLLDSINSPSDIKDFSHKQVSQLAEEIRHTIIDVVDINGGHLASNLGVVELTIALHRVFDSPEDAIVWDVSHQCYAHKLLTGRYKDFKTLRQSNGITGFTNTSESPHDFFISGHASTSISSALGLLTARQLEKKEGKVIAVIGDGALTGGMAFEALSHAGQLRKNLVVILNDNQMSIDHNTGSISRYLSKLTMTEGYQSMRHGFAKIRKILPFGGKHINKFIFRFKRSLKGLFFTNNLFTDLGFEYVGPLDGHNESALENVLKKVRKIKGPVVVHVVTKKGKGYDPAENEPCLYHGVAPLKEKQEKAGVLRNVTFTEAFSKIICDRAVENKNIVAITAAMTSGTGLKAFSKKFPERFFDVGIAEEHAVTFAGGLSAGGILPFVCIYSTFIQRSVDQIIHDISLQKSHAVFMLDRAGAVPGDGVTHQGIFDISLFRPVPDLSILSPATVSDLKACIEYAEKAEFSVVIRYPKAFCPDDMEEFNQPAEKGKSVLVSSSDCDLKDKTLIVCTGGMFTEVSQAAKTLESENIHADIYSLRFIKPFDDEYFVKLAEKYRGVLFVEDGIETGGISQYLNNLLVIRNYRNTKVLAFQEKYYEQGSRLEILKEAGLSPEHIINSVKDLCHD